MMLHTGVVKTVYSLFTQLIMFTTVRHTLHVQMQGQSKLGQATQKSFRSTRKCMLCPCGCAGKCTTLASPPPPKGKLVCSETASELEVTLGGELEQLGGKKEERLVHQNVKHQL